MGSTRLETSATRFLWSRRLWGDMAQKRHGAEGGRQCGRLASLNLCNRKRTENFLYTERRIRVVARFGRRLRRQPNRLWPSPTETLPRPPHLMISAAPAPAFKHRSHGRCRRCGDAAVVTGCTKPARHHPDLANHQGHRHGNWDCRRNGNKAQRVEGQQRHTSAAKASRSPVAAAWDPLQAGWYATTRM